MSFFNNDDGNETDMNSSSCSSVNQAVEKWCKCTKSESMLPKRSADDTVLAPFICCGDKRQSQILKSEKNECLKSLKESLLQIFACGLRFLLKKTF